jgi:hypothetical protein
MSWEVVGGPIDHAEPGVDARGWLWELRRGDEVRRLFVEVSGTALAVSRGLSSDTELAIATRGGSEVDKVVRTDDPPRRILCSTSGCKPVAAE